MCAVVVGSLCRWFVNLSLIGRRLLQYFAGIPFLRERESSCKHEVYVPGGKDPYPQQILKKQSQL